MRLKFGRALKPWNICSRLCGTAGHELWDRLPRSKWSDTASSTGVRSMTRRFDSASEVKAEIAKVSVFAPLHNRAELEGIAIVEKLLGMVPQVAVFDTGFHRTLPPHASVYPGPYRWLEEGIRRYGFHGINHQYCAERAAQLLRRDLASLKIVTCHLGNGCSLAAIRAANSIDTTMGFTPLEGLMMGTRSGSVDPGILIT